MESAEVAKVELAKIFGSLVKLVPPLHQKEFIKLIKVNYLKLGPRNTIKTREATLQVLSEVLTALPESDRQPYAQEYAQLIFNSMNKWRFKYVITEQFDILSKIFQPSTVHQILLPVFFSLCRDDCFLVRKNASLNIHFILMNCSQDQTSNEVIQVQLLGFGSYKRFTMRQSFIYMMEGILLHCPQLATADMIALLSSFAQDTVINNKICLA